MNKVKKDLLTIGLLLLYYCSEIIRVKHSRPRKWSALRSFTGSYSTIESCWSACRQTSC